MSVSLFLAFICLVIALIPYAGLVGLGPPALFGVVLAARARRDGDRRPLVLLAIALNGAWLALAILFAWAFLATLMGWPGGF